MTKEDVLDTLGNPLYVEKGWPTEDSNEIIWIYEVRSIQVAYDVPFNGEIKLVKDSFNKRPDKKIHKLRLTFNNGKLNHWEPIKEDKEDKSIISLENIDILNSITQVRSSSESWTFRPKLSIIKESYDTFDNWNGWNSSSSHDLRMGIDISKDFYGINLGVDITFGSGNNGLMLFIDKEILGFHVVAALGEDNDGDSTGNFKLGIFKDIKSFSVGYETLLFGRTTESYSEDHHSSNFVTIKYNALNLFN